MGDKCSKKDCDNAASYRFTWPGEDEEGICEEHRSILCSGALLMGFHLQVLPIEQKEQETKHE